MAHSSIRAVIGEHEMAGQRLSLQSLAPNRLNFILQVWKQMAKKEKII